MTSAAQLRTHLVTAATHLDRAWSGDGEITEIDRARRAIARALQVLDSESTEQAAPCDAGVDAGARNF